LDELTIGLSAVLLLFVAFDLLLGVGWPRALFTFGFFAIVPGALLLALFGNQPRPELRWLLYAVGTSLVLIMAVGLTLTIMLRPLGIVRPLSARFLGAAHVVLLSGLVVAVRYSGTSAPMISVPDEKTCRAWVSRWFRPTTFALLLLPSLTILSTTWLNQTGDNRPLIAVLVLIASMPITTARHRIGERFLSVAVGAVAISLLYHKTLWKFYHFSGQGNIIAAWQTGSWAIAERRVDAVTTPLLPNVTISSTFAHFTNISIFTQVDVFNPLLVACIPLGSFVLFRRFISPIGATLGAFLVTFIHPFYFQLPAGGRAAMPILFLVLLCVTATDTDLSAVLRQALTLAFAAALVTSHYGASYFVMVALLIALLLAIGVRITDSLMFNPGTSGIISDGGQHIADLKTRVVAQRSAFSVIFVFTYIIMTFAWYLYTFEGKKFRTFFSRVTTSLTSFLSGNIGGGTMARLTRNYGTTSIQLSRYIYIFLAILTAIGVGYLFIQRFTDRRWRNTEGFDAYLVIATGILAVFSLTFIFEAIWGGGRPTAIVFSVISLFTIIGIHAVVSTRTRFWKNTAGERIEEDEQIQVQGRTLFSVILAVFLVLNAGVGAAIVFGGIAPSNVPTHPQILERAETDPSANSRLHFEQDVSTYAWIKTHGSEDIRVFSDLITQNAAKDWYWPQVSAEVRGEGSSLSWRPRLLEAPEYRGVSYVVLSGHNTELNLAVPPIGPSHTGARDAVSMAKLNEVLSNEDRIYSAGDSRVYVVNDDA